MRTSLCTWGAALVFSLSSFLTPFAANAKDCSIGDGDYTCTFKDEAGNVSSGGLSLGDLNTPSGFFAISTNATLSDSGPCNCQVQGSIKDNGKPLKDNTSIICAGLGSPSALVGKISGNPNKPETLKVKGQVHDLNFNSSVGYLFSCEGNSNNSALQ
jgi:hypothetical protein